MTETSITFDDFSSSKKRQRRLTMGAVIIGAVIAIAVLLNFLRLDAKEAVGSGALAKVSRMQGNVMVKRGAETVSLEADMPVLPGDSFNTSNNAELEIVYLDESTKVVLHSNTSLLFNGNVGGKRTNLSSGTVRFEINRQPDNLPMVLASYNAEATVLEPGIYTQTYSGAGTRFVVEEGSLVARRYSDGRTDTVTAGETHVCKAEETDIIKFNPDGLD